MQSDPHPVSTSVPIRFARRAVYVYLSALLLELIAAGLWMSRGSAEYGLPEWLINYQAGFIRRGLTGELVRFMAHTTSIPLLLVAALVGICCYCVLFAVFALLLKRSTWRWWVYGLALNPALTFPVVSRTSFRKDVLFVAFLALAIYCWRQRQDGGWRDLSWGAALAIALPGMVLCQEPLFVYFPYIIAVPLIFTESIRRTLLLCALPLVLAVIALASVSKARGTPQQVSVICASVGKPDLKICPAGIRIAGVPPLDVPYAIHAFGYWKHYGIDLALALIPVVGGLYALRVWSSFAGRVLLFAMAVSAVGSISLFIVGIDWGRWINLHITSLSLLLLSLDGSAAATQMKHERKSMSRGQVAMVTAACLVYATCWSMPGNRDRPLFGYLSLGEKLLHWKGSFTD